MSTYLLASTPLYGHVAPLTTIGRRLVERGNRVVMVTGSRFEATVREAGLEFVALTGGADFDERDPATFVPDMDRYRGLALSRYQVQQTFVKPMADQWRAVSRVLEREPIDAVLVDCTFAGILPLLLRPRSARVPVLGAGVMPLAQVSRDVAPFNTALPPSSTPWGRLRNRALNVVARRVLFAGTQRLAERLLAEATGAAPQGAVPFVLDISAQFDRFLQLGPEEFEYPRSDLAPGVRFVGPVDTSRSGGPAPLPAWWSELEDGKPVVHVTQGTLDNHDFGTLVRPALAALAELDCHVVVSTGRAPVASLGALPANARAAEFLPYDRLLPRTDVLVTNGGYGSVLLALAHGVPLVVAPNAEDKPEVAARVAHFGVGVDLRTARPSTAAISAAVQSVLTDSRYRDRAAATAGALRRYSALETIERELGSAAAASA